MKSLLYCTFILLLFTALTGINSGINGTWLGEVQGPNGQATITYDFNVEADTLTGTVSSDMGEWEIFNGEVDSTTFFFETKVNNFTISHECEFNEEDDTITMKFTFGNQGPPQTMTLNRAPEEEE